MLTHPRLRNSTPLHLTAMATAFDQQRSSSQHAELSFDDRFGLLVDTEWTAREQRRLTQRLRHAKLRYPASLEDVDFSDAARPHARGRPQPRHGRLDPRSPQSADHRPDRHRQVVARVGLRAERLSPRLHRDLRPRAAAAARARRQSRRRHLRPAARRTRQARSARDR